MTLTNTLQWRPSFRKVPKALDPKGPCPLRVFINHHWNRGLAPGQLAHPSTPQAGRASLVKRYYTIWSFGDSNKQTTETERGKWLKGSAGVYFQFVISTWRPQRVISPEAAVLGASPESRSSEWQRRRQTTWRKGFHWQSIWTNNWWSWYYTWWGLRTTRKALLKTMFTVINFQKLVYYFAFPKFWGSGTW
jgi:hypothetical protein